MRKEAVGPLGMYVGGAAFFLGILSAYFNKGPSEFIMLFGGCMFALGFFIQTANSSYARIE